MSRPEPLEKIELSILRALLRDGTLSAQQRKRIDAELMARAKRLLEAGQQALPLFEETPKG